jgi:hypothetical protein
MVLSCVFYAVTYVFLLDYRRLYCYTITFLVHRA